VNYECSVEVWESTLGLFFPSLLGKGGKDKNGVRPYWLKKQGEATFMPDWGKGYNQSLTGVIGGGSPFFGASEKKKKTIGVPSERKVGAP